MHMVFPLLGMSEKLLSVKNRTHSQDYFFTHFFTYCKECWQIGSSYYTQLNLISRGLRIEMYMSGVKASGLKCPDVQFAC